MGLFGQIVLPIHGLARLILIIPWCGLFLHFAIRHRQKHQWRWRGLTVLNLLKGLGILAFGLWCLAPMIVIASQDPWHLKELDSLPPAEALLEAIRVFPEFLSSTNPLTSFCLVVLTGILFSILVSLRIAYMSEEEFLKDCSLQHHSTAGRTSQNPGETEGQTSKSLLGAIRTFFTVRPFILQKEPNCIRIEFHKISSQVLKAEFAQLCFLLFFFLLPIFGTFQMVMLALSEGMDIVNSRNPVVALIVWGFPVFSYIIVSYTIWQLVLRSLFVKKILDFTPNELVIGELAFGRYRKLFSIERANLCPLRETYKETTISELKAAILLIQHRGRQRELAAQLLPEAMETVQTVYDRYCASTFKHFYCDTQAVYLR